MRKLLIIALILSLLLVGCTTPDSDSDTPNTIDSHLNETSKDWLSQTDPTDTLGSENSGPAISDLTPTTPTVLDPSGNSTEGTKPAGSADAPVPTENQSTQQATEAPTTPTTPYGETKPTTPPETNPTVPTETEPEVTEPSAAKVDTSVIASQANAYAESLGFVVDSSLHKGNSGYYSPDYRPLVTNEQGVAAAKEMVTATKNQLNSRFSERYSDTLVESIFGLVRVNVLVEFSHTDELGNWYYIYVFYG